MVVFLLAALRCGLLLMSLLTLSFQQMKTIRTLPLLRCSAASFWLSTVTFDFVIHFESPRCALTFSLWPLASTSWRKETALWREHLHTCRPNLTPRWMNAHCNNCLNAKKDEKGALTRRLPDQDHLSCTYEALS